MNYNVISVVSRDNNQSLESQERKIQTAKMQYSPYYGSLSFVIGQDIDNERLLVEHYLQQNGYQTIYRIKNQDIDNLEIRVRDWMQTRSPTMKVAIVFDTYFADPEFLTETPYLEELLRRSRDYNADIFIIAQDVLHIPVGIRNLANVVFVFRQSTKGLEYLSELGLQRFKQEIKDLRSGQYLVKIRGSNAVSYQQL